MHLFAYQLAATISDAPFFVLECFVVQALHSDAFVVFIRKSKNRSCPEFIEKLDEVLRLKETYVKMAKPITYADKVKRQWNKDLAIDYSNHREVTFQMLKESLLIAERNCDTVKYYRGHYPETRKYYQHHFRQ